MTGVVGYAGRVVAVPWERWSSEQEFEAGDGRGSPLPLAGLEAGYTWKV